MFTKIIFIWYLATGVVRPTDHVDGRQIFTIKQKNFIVEYAYRGEILQWIDSGSFVYNEDLQD